MRCRKSWVKKNDALMYVIELTAGRNGIKIDIADQVDPLIPPSTNRTVHPNPAALFLHMAAP
ncbi:protein of unknown function [Georgfuchsia toluolica]|uniref:Uncharacterized protein n=1 Tax=Georgfuchsia toluolica TaxID=424218 RepID=A0A916J4I0_9PROT|nr:protein of unknown function [Georgfuchsia toluolica]